MGGYQPGTYSFGNQASNAAVENLGTPGKVLGSFLAPHKIADIWGGKQQPMLLGNVTPSWQEDLQRQRMLGGQYDKQMKKDLKYGEKEGNRLIQDGAFGRVGLGDYNDLVNTQKGRLEGFNSAEYGALRDTMNRENMRSYATSRENLARSQAYSGVRGATASAQQAKAGRDFNRSQIEGNQNLMIQNIGQKDKASGLLSQYLGQRSGVEQANNANKEREMGARLGIQFGYGQMGSANRSSAAQYFANADALNLQKQMFNTQQMNASSSKGGKK